MLGSLKSNSYSETEGSLNGALIFFQGGLYNVLIFECNKFNKHIFLAYLLCGRYCSTKCWWYRLSHADLTMSLEFIQQPAPQKLKEIPLGSLELRAVSNQVTVCELAPTNSFVRIKTLPVNIKNVDKWDWQLTIWIYLKQWLILCVNLTELRDSQIAVKILFLEVSVRVFQEETSIKWVDWRIALTNASGHHPILWRPE